MNEEECKYCTGFCEDLIQMKTSCGAMGEIHNTIWVSTDDLPDNNDPSELKMDFSLVADDEEVYGDVQKLRIHYCPMCGRKLK